VSGLPYSDQTRSLNPLHGNGTRSFTALRVHGATNRHGVTNRPVGIGPHHEINLAGLIRRPRRSALRPLHAHAQAAAQVLRQGQDCRRRQQGAVIRAKRGEAGRDKARRGDATREGARRRGYPRHGDAEVQRVIGEGRSSAVEPSKVEGSGMLDRCLGGDVSWEWVGYGGRGACRLCRSCRQVL
jgi:hypothetical protein